MRAAAAVLLLVGCSGEAAPEAEDATGISRALDRVAIRSGQLPDPQALSAPGAYGADTNIGEDRACVVGNARALRVGLLVAYGTGGECVGRGAGEVDGGRLRMTLERGCEMDARLDGDGLILPGAVSSECQSLCTGRASWAGVTIPKASDSAADALAITDGRGRALCPPT